MYTSTMLGSPSKSSSHTLASTSDFDTTSPLRLRRKSSTANSRLVRSIVSPPRRTVRDAGSTVRSPASSTTGRSRAPRRTSARNRASSTAEENGLVR